MLIKRDQETVTLQNNKKDWAVTIANLIIQNALENLNIQLAATVLTNCVDPKNVNIHIDFFRKPKDEGTMSFS